MKLNQVITILFIISSPIALRCMDKETKQSDQATIFVMAVPGLKPEQECAFPILPGLEAPMIGLMNTRLKITEEALNNLEKKAAGTKWTAAAQARQTAIRQFVTTERKKISDQRSSNVFLMPDPMADEIFWERYEELNQ